jgi:hypothetical protein
MFQSNAAIISLITRPETKCEGEEITNQMQKRLCFYWRLNMFRASLCPSSGEQDKADKSPTVYMVSPSPTSAH